MMSHVMLLLGLASGGYSADPGGSGDSPEEDEPFRPLAPYGDAELMAGLVRMTAADRAVAPYTASGSEVPITIEQHVRLQDEAARRKRAEFARKPLPVMTHRPVATR